MQDFLHNEGRTCKTCYQKLNRGQGVFCSRKCQFESIKIAKGSQSPSTATHGMSNTRFYKIWVAMHGRVLGPNHTARYRYQDRGITRCESWKMFENFRDDMYESYLKHVAEYGEADTTLDRINNDGNYEPTNCRWATRVEQRRNNSQPCRDKCSVCENKHRARGYCYKHYQQFKNGKVPTKVC